MIISVEAIFALLLLFILLLIFLEVVHRTMAALIGAFMAAYFGVIYHVFTYDDILGFIDFRLFIFVISIFIIVEVLDRAGVFHFLALALVNFVGASPNKLLLLFPLMATLLSAILSNIAAMVIVGALTVSIAKRLKIDPFLYLVIESIVASSPGGMVFIFSSIPTMLVSLKAGFTFLGYTAISIPLVILLTLVTILIIRQLYTVSEGAESEEVIRFNPWSAVKNRRVFHLSLFIFLVTLALFAISDRIGVGIETIAAGSAVILLALTDVDVEDVLCHVDWTTIFYFAGFFILVGSVEKAGVLKLISSQILSVTMGNPILLIMLFLWLSAILSGFVDNIPVTLTLIPMVKEIVLYTKVNPTPLWWSLLLGVSVGGNLTPLASPAGLMAMGILDKEGYTGYFYRFLKVCVIISLAQLLVATLYIYAIFVLLG